MSDFFMCMLQYVLIMAVLAGVGLLGGFLGMKLRKRKDAKGEQQQ